MKGADGFAATNNGQIMPFSYAIPKQDKRNTALIL
jgi:hypothetical protein